LHSAYVCVNLGIWFYYKSLGWLIHATANPPEQWVEAWAADGAKRVFGLFFGWLYAIIYFIVWLLPLWAIRKVVGVRKKNRRSNQALPYAAKRGVGDAGCSQNKFNDYVEPG